MHLFALTGAGISAESGLRTFRDPGGLWEQHDPRTLATPAAFTQDPALVHRFYNWRRQAARDAQPNAAHLALAHLQRGLAAQGHALTLVTQNVDDLHQRAGSMDVIAMHGSHATVRCTVCGATPIWAGDLSMSTPCPVCGRAGSLRPDIVWFGEAPLHTDRIAAALGAADAFVAIGTSGSVYPAAAYAAAARRHGLPTLEFNLEPANNAGSFAKSLYGPASETVPRFTERVPHEGWDLACANL